MISSLFASLDLARFAPFFPFALVVLAIIYIMLATIFRLSLSASFGVVIFLLVAAFFGDFDSSMASNDYGFFTDGIGQLGIKILLLAVMAICLMIMQKSADSARKMESMLLVLISTLGAMVTLASFNWMLLFIGLQCMSLPIYGLLAFDPHLSISSSARYLLMSFVAMAIMLFGILLLYAATGSMDLAIEGTKLAKLPSISGISGLGLIMIFIGLSFKVSLFPFHFWAPEVYSGARFFVISYLLIVVKSVVLLFILRMAYFLFNSSPLFTSIIGFMALLSMWIGNGMMLRQTSFIRLLAYLSIAHLGVLMIPILAHNSLGIEAIFIDIIAFGLAILLVFASAPKEDGARDIDVRDLEGLYYRRPLASITLAIALISITGFPLTAGFIGKLAIFQSAMASSLWYLIINFVLSSILGLAVIAKIIASMWQPSSGREPSTPARGPVQLLLCAALAILALGIFPEPLIAVVKSYTAGVL